MILSFLSFYIEKKENFVKGRVDGNLLSEMFFAKE